MNKITFYDKNQTSHLELEDYFPLRVVFDSAIGSNRFIGFYSGEKSFLEFTVDRQSGILRKFQIVTCENYQVIDSEKSIPAPSKTGTVAFNYSPHIDCDIFALSAYNNCVEISLSSDTVFEYYAVGQVLFGVNQNHNLVSVIVTDVTKEALSHLIYELQCD